MARVKTSLMICGLLFTLVACSQAPITISLATPMPSEAASATPYVADSTLASPTPWVEGTAAALASPTPSLAATETAIAATTAETQNVLPTLAPPSMQKPTDFSPVLYGGKVYQTTFFLLLGGVSKETWLAPDTSVARFSGEVTYSLHSFSQEAKYFLWGKSPEFSPTCKTYFVGTDAALDESGFVGVVDGWQVAKRPATELSADGEFYQQVVIDWLGEEGFSAPEVASIHVYRVDLEGDGTDEIFISATHLDDSQHTTKAGDYSIILMRQVLGNDTVTKLVVGDIYRSQEPEITFPRTYSLTNFIDLNQDGTLDVVVETRKWESFGARVFQIDDGDVIQALSAEC
jgi:hypothetical protein